MSRNTVGLFAGLALATIVAACSGGGGAVNNNPGGGGNPSPTPTAALNGTMEIVTSGTSTADVGYGAAANDQIVFSCGCTAQAGMTTSDASGNYTLIQNSPATPSAPNPTYTIVPGRNYVVIGQGAGAEAWTIQFAGKVPGHNLFLTNTSNSDIYTAAVALYVFQNSTSSSTAFDDWNFFNLQNWYTTLKNSPNAAETTLLDDIVKQSVAAQPLYPSHPGWNALQPTNPTIKTDLVNVKASVDATKPTPCPTDGAGNALCTGTPSP